MVKKSERRSVLRVVAYVDDDGLVILRGLEHDVAAHGDSPEAAKTAFAHAILRHILAAVELDEPLFNGVPPAPNRFWEQWARSQEQGGKPETIHIPNYTIRQRSDQPTQASPQRINVVAEMLSGPFH